MLCPSLPWLALSANVEGKAGARILCARAPRDNGRSRIDWQFSDEDARIKLKRPYPTLDGGRDTGLLQFWASAEGRCSLPRVRPNAVRTLTALP